MYAQAPDRVGGTQETLRERTDAYQLHRLTLASPQYSASRKLAFTICPFWQVHAFCESLNIHHRFRGSR
jgi:hypothetical protein